MGEIWTSNLAEAFTGSIGKNPLKIMEKGAHRADIFAIAQLTSVPVCFRLFTLSLYDDLFVNCIV